MRAAVVRPSTCPICVPCRGGGTPRGPETSQGDVAQGAGRHAGPWGRVALRQRLGGREAGRHQATGSRVQVSLVSKSWNGQESKQGSGLPFPARSQSRAAQATAGVSVRPGGSVPGGEVLTQKAWSLLFPTPAGGLPPYVPRPLLLSLRARGPDLRSQRPASWENTRRPPFRQPLPRPLLPPEPTPGDVRARVYF